MLGGWIFQKDVYGSTALAPIVGHEMDLIAVRGINNTRGYAQQNFHLLE